MAELITPYVPEPYTNNMLANAVALEKEKADAEYKKMAAEKMHQDMQFGRDNNAFLTEHNKGIAAKSRKERVAQSSTIANKAHSWIQEAADDNEFLNRVNKVSKYAAQFDPEIGNIMLKPAELIDGTGKVLPDARKKLKDTHDMIDSIIKSTDIPHEMLSLEEVMNTKTGKRAIVPVRKDVGLSLKGNKYFPEEEGWVITPKRAENEYNNVMAMYEAQGMSKPQAQEKYNEIMVAREAAKREAIQDIANTRPATPAEQAQGANSAAIAEANPDVKAGLLHAEAANSVNDTSDSYLRLKDRDKWTDKAQNFASDKTGGFISKSANKEFETVKYPIIWYNGKAEPITRRDIILLQKKKGHPMYGQPHQAVVDYLVQTYPKR